jgi:pimeloyl-ACP methyl ester carboxylesterase
MLGGMPINAFVISALVDRGWRVVQVWDEYDASIGRLEWPLSRARAALDWAGETRLMVAKSATTLATGLAADRSVAGVWLTPLLREEACADGLRRRTAPALVIGGTEDPAWDPALARELADEVLELEGADHGLARIEDLQSIVDAAGRFAERSESS